MSEEARPFPPLPPLVDSTSTYRPVIRHRTPTVRGSLAHALADDPLASAVVLALVIGGLFALGLLAMLVVGMVA